MAGNKIKRKTKSKKDTKKEKAWKEIKEGTLVLVTDPQGEDILCWVVEKKVDPDHIGFFRQLRLGSKDTYYNNMNINFDLYWEEKGLKILPEAIWGSKNKDYCVSL